MPSGNSDVMMELLLVVAMVLSLGLFIGWRHLRRLEAAMVSSRASDAAQLAQLRKALQSISRSCQVLDKRTSELAARQQELETRDVNRGAYAQAGRMVELGAESDDLVQSCGLSEAEARLLAMMYQQRNIKRPSL